MKGGVRGSGFMQLILSVLAVVLVTSMFGSIMTALVALLAVAGVANFIGFATIVGIAPTILLLALTIGGGLLYFKGYKMAGASDTNGLMRIVFGVLMLILFITLFVTVAGSFVTLNTTYGGNTTWVAFGTVVTIVPTILFLAGIGGSIATSVSGYKARGKRKALR